MAVVATCSLTDVASFPASDIITYKRMTNYQSHYHVEGGIQTVQKALSKGLHVKTDAMVTSITPKLCGGCQKIDVTWKSSSSSVAAELAEEFDVVVLAVSPDVAHHIYKPLARQLSRIPMRKVEATVYRSETNKSCLVSDGIAAQFVIVSDGQQVDSIHDRCAPGYSIRNRVIGLPSPVPKSPADGIHRTNFTRVIRTPESRNIVNKIFKPRPGSSSIAVRSTDLDTRPPVRDQQQEAFLWNGDDSIFLVGGWCWDGMVLLEGCIVSAMRVARCLGVDIPWEDD
jgi:hypothetical protein